MDEQAKIFVAGHRGLVGSAIVRKLKSRGYNNLLLKPHSELELRDYVAVHAFLAKEKPDYIFLAAAKVGGILANNNYPADFIYDNLLIQTNIIHSAHEAGVQRMMFLGSSCIYPRECPQPMKEEYLLTGTLELTNRPYAVAKIAGLEMAWAYNRQYGRRYISAMPTNLYGEGDNYDLNHSHVLPALIRKMYEAKSRNEASVTLWGTGSPRREFLYSDDLAAGCVHLMEADDATTLAPLFNNPSQPPLVNIGCGEDITIKELADKVKETVGFQGNIIWDSTKPDGTPRKLLDISRMMSLGWQPTITLNEGLHLAYQAFLREHKQAAASSHAA